MFYLATLPCLCDIVLHTIYLQGLYVLLLLLLLLKFSTCPPSPFLERKEKKKKKTFSSSSSWLHSFIGGETFVYSCRLEKFSRFFFCFSIFHVFPIIVANKSVNRKSVSPYSRSVLLSIDREISVVGYILFSCCCCCCCCEWAFRKTGQTSKKKEKKNIKTKLKLGIEEEEEQKAADKVVVLLPRFVDDKNKKHKIWNADFSFDNYYFSAVVVGVWQLNHLTSDRAPIRVSLISTPRRTERFWDFVAFSSEIRFDSYTQTCRPAGHYPGRLGFLR